jgi:nicotinate-nucleotide adenylyltransferase
MVLAQEAVCRLRLDRLLLVPSVDPPHRDRPAAAAGDRIAMLQRAVEGVSAMEVSDMEIRRPGKSYTILTVRDIRELHGGCRPFVLVGSDCIRDLPHWKEIRALLDQCTMVIATRPGTDTHMPAALEERVGSKRVAALRRDLLPIPAIDVSSSLVRERIRAGLPIRYLVPDPVARFVAERNLYRE